MLKYKPGDEVGPLEFWPFDNPASNYSIREGEPRTSGRIDSGGPGHPTRHGIWRCTRGAFDCTEQGDELMTILSGQCRITDLGSGETTALTPGDSYLMPDGRRVRWDIAEDVTKVFFGHKPEGF